jgi:hypothetical protein
MTFDPTSRRRFGKIPAAVEHSAISRTELYGLAATHPGLFRKYGRSTIVDFGRLDEVLDNLPAAKIRPDKRRLARTNKSKT